MLKNLILLFIFNDFKLISNIVVEWIILQIFMSSSPQTLQSLTVIKRLIKIHKRQKNSQTHQKCFSFIIIHFPLSFWKLILLHQMQSGFEVFHRRRARDFMGFEIMCGLLVTVNCEHLNINVCLKRLWLVMRFYESSNSGSNHIVGGFYFRFYETFYANFP